MLASSRFRVPALILAVLLVGGLWINSRHSTPAGILEHPEYLSFAGNYVFTIPPGNAVDERIVTGLQVVHTGSLSAKDLDELYRAGGITLQPLTFLADHTKSGFKKYVNQTFIPDIKKSLSADAQLKYTSVGGWDVAKITIRKDNAPLRYVYLKNGRHPVAIVSKDENEAFKKITQTITDVENTDLKTEVSPLKQTVLDAAKLIKDQKAHELYLGATAELRSKSSEADVASALSAVAQYGKGDITIEGGSYNSGEFTVVVNFAPLNRDIKPAPGAMYLDKSEGQWKLKVLQLPKQ